MYCGAVYCGGVLAWRGLGGGEPVRKVVASDFALFGEAGESCGSLVAALRPGLAFKSCPYLLGNACVFLGRECVSQGRGKQGQC